MKKMILFIVIIFLSSCGREQVPGAMVRNFTGMVTINDKAVTASGITVKAGDLIKTLEGAFCEIVIGEKNIIMIRANSELLYDLSGKESKIELRKGWLAGVTKKIFRGADRRKFFIKTPTVTAGVRGTSFCVKVENKDSTYFCVCNGEIELSGQDKSSGEIVTASHHSARRYRRISDGSIETDSKPGLLYHGDELVEKLAESIGEKIDWTKPDLN